MRDWDGFNALVRSQHGAVSPSQALDHGINERTIRRIAADQCWLRPHRGVVVSPAVEPTYATWVSAAILAVRQPVLASRLTAAHLLGITDAAPDDIQLVIPHRRRAPVLEPAHGPPLAIWRSRTLIRSDECPAQGLPATTAQRTFCDLPPVMKRADLRSLLIDARQRRLVSPEQVLARAARLKWAPNLHELKRTAYELDSSRCDSVLAEWAARVLRREGLPPDAFEHPVTTDLGVTVHLDVAYIPYRVGVEAEGMGAHSSRAQLEADVRRRTTLGTTDWRIVWISWARLETDPRGFVADVRRALIARGWPGPPALI